MPIFQKCEAEYVASRNRPKNCAVLPRGNQKKCWRQLRQECRTVELKTTLTAGKSRAEVRRARKRATRLCGAKARKKFTGCLARRMRRKGMSRRAALRSCKRSNRNKISEFMRAVVFS